MEFKDTGGKTPEGHVTDTKCKPDITAAFTEHWKPGGSTLWPCIRLTGEKASKGKNKDIREKQAISYLHYHLLSRPDFHVVQGLFTTETGIAFLLGVGGDGVRSLKVPWRSDGLYKLIYAFVYRLYEPGDFADKSYVKMSPNLDDGVVSYTVRITATQQVGDKAGERPIECPDFVPVSARNPFEARTHVLSNPNSDIMIGNKRMTVLKDQLCRLGSRFDEHVILSRVHSPEAVPGVVEMVYKEVINIQFLGVARAKYRTGLVQSGLPFMDISTLQQMLEIAFDTLEVG